MQVISRCRPSLYAYPGPESAEAATSRTTVPVAVLSTTARARERAQRKAASKASRATVPSGDPEPQRVESAHPEEEVDRLTSDIENSLFRLEAQWIFRTSPCPNQRCKAIPLPGAALGWHNQGFESVGEGVVRPIKPYPACGAGAGMHEPEDMETEAGAAASPPATESGGKPSKPEPSSYMLDNPARILPAQQKVRMRLA